jgi:hypothetical protein
MPGPRGLNLAAGRLNERSASGPPWRRLVPFRQIKVLQFRKKVAVGLLSLGKTRPRHRSMPLDYIGQRGISRLAAPEELDGFVS